MRERERERDHSLNFIVALMEFLLVFRLFSHCRIFLKCWVMFFCFSFRVRFHYGHPDVFDRLFHLTRGGVSKASKVINLSEDIFAGLYPFLSNSLFSFTEESIIWMVSASYLIISMVCRFQFYITWWKCHSSWIHTSW